MKKRIRIFSVLLVTSLLLWSVAFSVSSINFTDIGTELTMMEEKVYATQPSIRILPMTVYWWYLTKALAA